MKLSTSIKSLISRILTKSLKPRTKRLLMLASLGAHICKRTTFDKTSMSKLNTVMALSRRDDALVMPILISKVIWNGHEGSEILYNADETIQEAPKRFLDQVPQWLRYSEEEMECDIQQLLDNRSVLPT